MTGNSKILKNTMMLYIRMALMMLISLYTSRIVLKTLGIEDYGIYNIVGGVVIMFSFLNLTLTVAIRRFLSVALATNDTIRFSEILRASVVAVFIASIILVVGLETIGIWFLNNKINIPADRLYAANITFHLSILTFLCNLNVIPYNSAIVSCERMGIYAYLGIAEAVLKLGLILLLPLCFGDELINYSIIILLLAFWVTILNYGYCYFKIVKIQNLFSVKQSDVLAIFQFSAWSVLGSIVFMLATHGVNIIYNMFFGVTLNAALGIASQVNSAINQFIGNFQTAFNPPLTKSYAINGLDANTFDFVCDTSRMTFVLVVVIGFPVIMNMDSLLNVWLTTVPQYAKGFSILYILYTAIDGCSGPLYMLVYANGKIREYQLLLSGIQILYVILVYVLCIHGLSPVLIFSMNIINGLLLFGGRLFVLKRLMNFPVLNYLNRVLIPAILPLLFLLIGGMLMNGNMPNISSKDLVLRLSLSGIMTLVTVYFLYLNRRDRLFLLQTIKSRLLK